MMNRRALRRLAVSAVFVFAALAASAADQVAATNKLNGITLRGDLVKSECITIQNTNAVDFAVWATTDIEVQHFDVVMASLVPAEPALAHSAQASSSSAAQAVVKLKTKSSAEWTVTGERRAFVMTEDAPLMIASTAGANVKLTLEVLRDEPPQGHPYKPKRRASPMRIFKRL